MKDIIGVEINVGDFVVVQNPNGYSGLCISKVIKITPKMIRVKYGKTDADSRVVYPQDVCKIDSADALAYALRHGL